jgi:hypothetical protein
MACTKNSACYLCTCGVHLLLIFAREAAFAAGLNDRNDCRSKTTRSASLKVSAMHTGVAHDV